MRNMGSEDHLDIRGGVPTGVGRLRSMSKLKYEWSVIVGGGPGVVANKYYIHATYSRLSKKVRAYVNCVSVFNGTLKSASGSPRLTIPLDLSGKKALIRYAPEVQGLELVKDEEMKTLASSFVACLQNANQADGRSTLRPDGRTRSRLMQDPPSDVVSDGCAGTPLCSEPVKMTESSRRRTIDLANISATSESHMTAGPRVDVSAPSTAVEYESWENVPIASEIAGHVDVKNVTEPIGRLMSSTKMLHTWEFIYNLDDIERLALVELVYSRRSKKVRIKVNNELVFDDLLVQQWQGVRFRLDNAKVVSDGEHLYSVLIRYDWDSQDFVAEYNRDAHITLRRANMQSEVFVDSVPDQVPVARISRAKQCIRRCLC